MTSNSPRVMMGLEVFGDQKVPVPVRDWNSMKLALWRSKAGWDIVARAAAEIIASCAHHDDCPARHVETTQCLSDVFDYTDVRDAEGNVTRVRGALLRPGCRDREKRMSALVILNAARTCSPTNVNRASGEHYTAPSREHYSEVLAELAAKHGELEALYAWLSARGIEPPTVESMAGVPPQLETEKELTT